MQSIKVRRKDFKFGDSYRHGELAIASPEVQDSHELDYESMSISIFGLTMLQIKLQQAVGTEHPLCSWFMIWYV